MCSQKSTIRYTLTRRIFPELQCGKFGYTIFARLSNTSHTNKSLLVLYRCVLAGSRVKAIQPIDCLRLLHKYLKSLRKLSFYSLHPITAKIEVFNRLSFLQLGLW